MSKAKCKKLGNAATKRERAEAHRVKMEMKKVLREHRREEALENRRGDWILANISQNHEYYGDTPSEHEKRKNGIIENNS